ncbi:MAG: hypothetical protein WC390_12280, partial [Sulfurimonas sp.]
FLSSDASLTGAFSAIQDVFGPTFEHIFDNLKIAGLETYLSLGNGVVNMANNIGSVLSGAINIAIEAFARLAGAADDALGGAISKLLGLQGNGTSTGTASSSWVDPNAIYKNLATNTEMKGSAISNMAVESDYIKMDSNGSTDISLQTGTVHAASLVLSASDSRLSNALGEMKLHTMTWGEDGAGMGYAGTSAEQVQLASDFKDVKENTASDGWLGGALKSIAKGDEQVSGSGEFAGTKAEIEEIPAAYKEVAETTQRKTSNDLDFGFAKVSGGLDGLSQIGKDGIKTTAEDNALFRAIVDKWQQKWEDKPLFSETAYGKEIQAEISRLRELENIKDTIESVGGNNEKDLADVKKTITDTKAAITSELADVAAGIKEASLFYGEFQGATKDYPEFKDAEIRSRSEAARINYEYGINAIGEAYKDKTQYGKIFEEMGGKREDAMTKALRLEAESRIKATVEIETDAAKEEVANLNSDVQSVTSEPLVPTIDTTQAKNDLEEISTIASDTPLAMKLGIDDSVFQGTGSFSAVDGNKVTATAWNTLQSPSPQDTAQLNQLIGPLNLIRTAQQATTTATRQISQDVRNMSALDRTAMLMVGNTISANIVSSAASINATISQSAANIMEVLREVMADSGGSGSGSGGSGGSLSYANMDMPFYLMASGGYVDRPTFAMIGEGGEGEYITPESQMQNLIQNLSSNVNVSVGFDISDTSRELESALSGISIPTISVPIAIAIDSSEVRAAIHQAIAEEFDNLRLH